MFAHLRCLNPPPDGSFSSSVFAQGIPELVEGNAELLGNALTEKGFLVTRPQARKRSPATV